MKKVLLTLILAACAIPFSHAQDNDDEDDELRRAPFDFLDMFNTDRRDKEMVMTNTKFLYGLGFYQALGDGNGIGDAYQFWGSAYFDFGLEFSTRLNKENDNMRFNYGLSFRSSSLRIRDENVFVTQDRVTDLVDLSADIERSRFSQFMITAPLHLEFGSRTLTDYKDGLKRYGSDDDFVFGIGGYLGYVTTSTQSIEFDREGRDVTDARTNDYEINNFQYGLSAYAGWNDLQLSLTYGLNEIFDNSPIEHRSVSIGLRVR